jgi:D-sedoheptulose 7-phosphate isomerase
MLRDAVLERLAQAYNLLKVEHTAHVGDIVQLAEKVFANLNNGKCIAFVGNGGSAAEAIHLAAEFTGKCVIEHKPMRAMCLNESQSALTAIANDYGTEFMFSRLVEAHLSDGDILIAMTTSGKSMNILKALEVATEIGVECYMWTGNTALEVANVKMMKVDSNSTPRVQEIHLLWGHILAETVELLAQEK